MIRGEDTKSNFALHINISDVGMPIELSVVGDETLTGAYESNAKITFSIIFSDPLAEVVIHSTESDKKAEPVSIPDGAQIVEIKENISEEDMAPIIQVLQEKGLPMLMENLSKALPDEYGLIMQMLSASSQQEGSVKSN